MFFCSIFLEMKKKTEMTRERGYSKYAFALQAVDTDTQLMMTKHWLSEEIPLFHLDHLFKIILKFYSSVYCDLFRLELNENGSLY